MPPIQPQPDSLAGTDAPESESKLTTEDVVAKFSDKFKVLIDEQISRQIDTEKIYRYAAIRQADLYARGSQYISMYFSGEGFVDFQPSNETFSSPLNQSDDGPEGFDYVFNIYKGFLRKFTAVIGQRAPNTKAVPIVRGDSKMIRMANVGTKAASALHQCWQSDQKQRQLTYGLGKSGTMFIYTSFVADPDRYGVTQEPILEPRTVKAGEDQVQCPTCGYFGGISTTVPDPMAPVGMCPECGTELDESAVVPAPTHMINDVVGEEVYSNGGVEAVVLSETEVTTPFYIRSLDDSPWLRYQCEEDRGRLLALFPELRKTITQVDKAYTGWGQTGAYGRHIREQMGSSTGLVRHARPQRWLYERFWLQPSMFQYFEGSPEQDALRNELIKSFPLGLKITSVNGFIVQAEHESLTEVWTACKPEESEYLYTEAYLSDMIRYQDLFNDAGNIVVEGMERMIGVTFADPSVVDPTTIKQKGNLVGEYIFTNPMMGGNIKDSLYHTQLADVDPKIMQISDYFLGNAQEVTSLTPSVWGGGAGVETAAQEKILRDQALAVLSTVWNNMRDAWERATENGIIQLAKYSIDNRVYFPVRFPGQSVHTTIHGLTGLLDGGWACSAEEHFPMNSGQKREYFIDTLTQLQPETLQFMQLFHPSNLGAIQELIGLPDLKNPSMDEYDRIHDVIYELLETEPITDIDPMTGAVVTVPAIQPDLFLFIPETVVAIVREWALSDEGHAAKQSNPMGYEHVISYGMEYQRVMQEQLAAQAAAAPADGEDSGGSPVKSGSDGGGGSAVIPPNQQPAPSPGLTPSESPESQPLSAPVPST